MEEELGEGWEEQEEEGQYSVAFLVDCKISSAEESR